MYTLFSGNHVHLVMLFHCVNGELADAYMLQVIASSVAFHSLSPIDGKPQIIL